MSMKLCPKCGRELRDEAIFCTFCGSKLEAPPPAPTFCTACGKPLSPGAKFCTGCGAPGGDPLKGASRNRQGLPRPRRSSLPPRNRRKLRPPGLPTHPVRRRKIPLRRTRVDIRPRRRSRRMPRICRIPRMRPIRPARKTPRRTSPRKRLRR